MPIVGNLLEFRRDRLGLQRRLVSECGDAGQFRMGPVPVLNLASPALIHSLLVEHNDAFVKSRGLGRFGRVLLGDGLLTSEHDLHRRQRKLLAPAFQTKRIAAYAGVMAEETEKAQAKFATGAELDLAEEMMKLTLSVVGRTLFDADVTGDARVVADGLTSAMEYMLDSITSLWAPPLSWPTPRNRKMQRALAALDEVVYRIIAARRKEGGDRGDVLSMLLLARDEDDGTGMTDRQVRDEVMTLILAGHETTANALSWTFHLLLSHREIYDRAQAEVATVLAGRTPTLEDLPRLPYTLQVFKESMRLYPPAYIIGREATRPVQIGPYAVPEGGVVMVSIYGMHRRAEYFPNPERFDPDRFAPEAEKQIPKGAYMPFGGGPRVCIGNHFAMMEGHIILATLLGRVRFSRRGTASIEAEPMVTLRPRGGVPVRVAGRI